MGRSRSRDRDRSRRSRRRSRSSERSKKRSKRSRSRSRSRDRRSGGGETKKAFDAGAVKAALLAAEARKHLANALENAMATDPSGALVKSQVQQATGQSIALLAPPTNNTSCSDIMNLAANKQATRSARRLYVGNLPLGIGLNESMLVDFFNASMNNCGMDVEHPVFAVAMKPDQQFCFLEFRRVKDVPQAMTILGGLSLGVNVLKVAKPTDFAEAPAHLLEFEIPLPTKITVGAKSFQKPAFNPQGNMNANAPIYPFHPNTRSHVIVLVDIIVTTEEARNQADSIADIYWECSKYSPVKKIIFGPIDLPPDEAPTSEAALDTDKSLVAETNGNGEATTTADGANGSTEDTKATATPAPTSASAKATKAPSLIAANCFITFDTQKSAGCALLALRKRSFNSRRLNPQFFDATALSNGQLGLEHMITS